MTQPRLVRLTRDGERLRVLINFGGKSDSLELHEALGFAMQILRSVAEAVETITLEREA